MASKLRESDTNIEVNLFYVIVMRPKLSRSANGARAHATAKVHLRFGQIDALLRKMTSFSGNFIGQVLVVCF